MSPDTNDNNFDLPNKSDYVKISKLVILKKTSKIASIVLFFLAILLLIVYYSIKAGYKDIIKSHEEELINNSKHLIARDFAYIESDLFFLRNLVEEAIHSSGSIEQSKEEITQHFFQFTLDKNYFDQVRIIDSSGKEFIRINNGSNKTFIVHDSELQDKSKRYYFKNTMQCPPGTVYVSPFDLNIEDGKIEKPHKPMIRFAVPIVGKDNSKRGIIILNYVGDKILTSLRSVSERSYGNLLFVNTQGYYFVGFTQAEEWGFMFNKKEYNFSRTYRSEWSKIINKKALLVSSENGLFFSQSYFPLAEKQISSLGSSSAYKSDIRVNSDAVYWFFISYVSNEQLFSIMKPFFLYWVNILSITFLFIVIITWYMVRHSLYKAAYQKRILYFTKHLKRLNATKDKFFSILAHDLRNPLQALILNIELIHINHQRGELNKQKILINKAKNTSYMFKDLLDNLLTWARSQKGVIEFEPKSFNLCDICKKTIAIGKAFAEKKDINISVEKCHQRDIFADKNMVETVIRNLLFNAIKFTPSGGKVEIECYDGDEMIIVSVKDSGIGISEEDQKKIFRIDVQFSKKGTENEEGSGLGLILCKDFIEKNGGKIWVKSMEGKGSIFYFSIPKSNENVSELQNVSLN